MKRSRICLLLLLVRFILLKDDISKGFRLALAFAADAFPTNECERRQL